MTMTMAKGYSLNVQYKVRWPKQKPAKQENLSGEPWYQVNSNSLVFFRSVLAFVSGTFHLYWYFICIGLNSWSCPLFLFWSQRLVVTLFCTVANFQGILTLPSVPEGARGPKRWLKTFWVLHGLVSQDICPPQVYAFRRVP